MRERNEPKFRGTIGKDGRVNATLGLKTSKRLQDYCRAKNTNRTKFIEYCINSTLDKLEREAYASMSKDELIDFILKR